MCPSDKKIKWSLYAIFCIWRMRAGAVDVLCAAPGLSYLLASVETDLNDKLLLGCVRDTTCDRPEAVEAPHVDIHPH